MKNTITCHHNLLQKPLLLLMVFSLVAGLLLATGAGRAGAEEPASNKLDAALIAELGTAGPDLPLEVVIVFSDMSAAPQVEALAGAFYQMKELPMAGAILTKNEILQLARWPEIYSIALNSQLEYFLDQSISYIGADQVWQTYGQTGGNTTVAVIDSGIDATHPDLLLGYKVIENLKVLPFSDPIPGVPTTDNSSGHGTHVAGTIAGMGTASSGHYRGVAHDAKLIGLGAGEAIFVLTAIQAYDWVLQHHNEYNIRVVNNSWGASGGSINVRNPIVIATYQAYQEGILSVFAAGNDGGYDIVNPYSITPWVLSVAAADTAGNLADFSSRGLEGDPYKHPDLTAPGVNIYSTRCSCIGITALDPLPNPVNPTWTAHYTAMSGTSMATPHVAGAAALLFSARPTLSPDQVIALLVDNTTPMVDYALFEAGSGYLNAYDAFVASQSVSGNLAAFLAGDQLYDIDSILNIGEEPVSYTVEEHSGTTAAGAGGIGIVEHAINVSDDTLFVDVLVSWTPQLEDAYDIEILDPQGNVVVSSGNGLNETEVAFFVPEVSGEYTLRIIPFAAVATQYTATVSLANSAAQ